VFQPKREQGTQMSQLQVFEAAMCCPTGVCGVEVDPVLVQFNTDLQWLAQQGVAVSRHGLGHDAAAFAAHQAVLQELKAGMDRLPISVVNGQIVATGTYLSRAQLVQKLGLDQPAEGAVAASAPACGCQPGQCC
jgi:hypothetical protein